MASEYWQALPAKPLLLALGRYDELAAALEGATGTRLSLALRALFTRDPARAFDHLALTPRDSALLDSTLYVLFLDICSGYPPYDAIAARP